MEHVLVSYYVLYIITECYLLYSSFFSKQPVQTIVRNVSLKHHLPQLQFAMLLVVQRAMHMMIQQETVLHVLLVVIIVKSCHLK